MEQHGMLAKLLAVAKATSTPVNISITLLRQVL